MQKFEAEPQKEKEHVWWCCISLSVRWKEKKVCPRETQEPSVRKSQMHLQKPDEVSLQKAQHKVLNWIGLGLGLGLDPSDPTPSSIGEVSPVGVCDPSDPTPSSIGEVSLVGVCDPSELTPSSIGEVSLVGVCDPSYPTPS